MLQGDLRIPAAGQKLMITCTGKSVFAREEPLSVSGAAQRHLWCRRHHGSTGRVRPQLLRGQEQRGRQADYLLSVLSRIIFLFCF